MSAVFSARFIQERNKKGLTQAELASTLNKKRSTISGYETGGKEPDFDTLCEFAEFFGVSTDYLLGLSNTPGNRDEMLHGISAKMKDLYLIMPATLRDTVSEAYKSFYDILYDDMRSACSERLSTYVDLFSAIAGSRNEIKKLVDSFGSSAADLTALSDVLSAQNDLKHKVEDILDKLLENDLRVAMDKDRR